MGTIVDRRRPTVLSYSVPGPAQPECRTTRREWPGSNSVTGRRQDVTAVHGQVRCIARQGIDPFQMKVAARRGIPRRDQQPPLPIQREAPRPADATAPQEVRRHQSFDGR